MKIAITGTMGAGKSSVNDYLIAQGYRVFDTDKMVHAYYEPNGKLVDVVVDLLGETILTKGNIDRKKMASLVFSDKTKLEALENLIHPTVLEDMLRVDDQGEIVFFEVPQLFESKMESHFDAIITIDAEEPIRIERLLKRGMSQETINARLKHQMSGDEKQALSDYVIDNSGNMDDLYKQINEIIEKLKKGEIR